MNSDKRLKVLLGPSFFAEYDHCPLDRLQEAGCEIIKNPYRRKLTKEEVIKLLSSDVVGLIAGLETIDREVLINSNLKVISRCGSGLSNIDLEAAVERGIKVYSTPEAPVTAVAELTLGAMIGLLRLIPQMNQQMHEGKWSKITGMQLEGKAVVIVGFGRIGKKVASLLKPFNVRIIAVDPNLKENKEGVEILPLYKALPVADIITLHSSGDNQIIGDNEFRLVKQGAFLLNAARGGLVNEESLIQALKDGKIAGAWLDTFNTEPYTGNLSKFSQVILTPHIGSYTFECRKVMEMEAVNNLISALKVKKNQK